MVRTGSALHLQSFCRGLCCPSVACTRTHKASGRKKKILMMTFVAAVMFLALVVVALYVFGVFDTPYLEAFRWAFYLLLVLLVLTVGFELMNPHLEGYTPTARTP